MNLPTTVRLTDRQIKWINEMNLNVSKYVRSLIDKDMIKWKDITEKVLQPIIDCEQELDESQYHEVQNKHRELPND
ncbi:MAG: hypothetical protein HOB51_01400 [Thaumarchaeota archaeon]|mgnify:FL=1|jgi:hypothetical protein|nr:hypothetical protein [Nitrososphaerota archaeon]